jgi:predicted PurR-regulated permease PerM
MAEQDAAVRAAQEAREAQAARIERPTPGSPDIGDGAHPADPPDPAESKLGAEDPPDEPADVGRPTAEHPAGRTPNGSDDDFGRPGPPINRNNPFYIGFFFALGALIAYEVIRLIGSLSGMLTLVVTAAFLAIGLDPVVRFLQRRGLKRGLAVSVVFIGVLLVFAGIVAAVVPTVITQGSELTQQLPDTVNNLQRSRTVRKLDADYGVITNLSNQLRDRVSDGDTIMSLFGGVLGAGRAVLSGVTSTLTVLILTLYFLASLNKIAEAGYRLVPRSRRERVRSLGDEILRRIGGYVAGQILVASINAVCSFVFMTALGIPYALVLAVVVGILGLIPLVGATLGAIIVVLVALFQAWTTGVIVAIYYLVYQQIENYLIVPRIMSRTVAVPGAVALIAALAGGTLLGVLGALIAIPIAAALLLVVQEVVVPRQERT